MRANGHTYILGGIVLATTAIVGYMLLVMDPIRVSLPEAAVTRLQLKDIPFNGARAYGYLKQICDIGPRRSGTQGMKDQQKLLTEHFKKLGATVDMQEFRVRHPQDGTPVDMANMIVRWQPESTERVLLSAHYDTRPYPDQDPVNRQGRFIGANDGGSGVAVLMELGNDMAKIKPAAGLGVDFVLFDGEELVYSENDEYFLGSDYFSRDYAAKPPAWKYRCGVLLDMVGGANLQLYQERNSVSWNDTKAVVDRLWGTASKLGVREFAARPKYTLRDDHLKLNLIAKIPTCDVVDFDYPYWHKTGDIPDNCSDLSLAKVGWVLEEWLKRELSK